MYLALWAQDDNSWGEKKVLYVEFLYLYFSQKVKKPQVIWPYLGVTTDILNY